MPELLETRESRNAFFKIFPDFGKRDLRTFQRKLRKGEIDGTVFNYLIEVNAKTVQAHCCFYGTIAAIRGKDGFRLSEAASDCYAAEQVQDYVMNIRSGDTPENSRYARNVDNWVTRYLENA